MKRLMISPVLKKTLLVSFIFLLFSGLCFSVPQPVYMADLTYRNVKSFYGAHGDTTDDYNSLNMANTKAHHHTLYFPSGTYAVNTNLSFDPTITLAFENGSKLRPASGKQLTINGDIISSPRNLIFDYSSNGTIIFGSNLPNVIYPEWWGAKGDGVTDDSPAIQEAINSITLCGGTVYFNSTKRYALGSTVVVSSQFPINLKSDMASNLDGVPTCSGYFMPIADLSNGMIEYIAPNTLLPGLTGSGNIEGLAFLDPLNRSFSILSALNLQTWGLAHCSHCLFQNLLGGAILTNIAQMCSISQSVIRFCGDTGRAAVQLGPFISSGGGYTQSLTFDQNKIEVCYSMPYVYLPYPGAGTEVKITNNGFESNDNVDVTTRQVYIDVGTTKNHISGNHFDRNRGTNIWLRSTANDNVLSDNIFYGWESETDPRIVIDGSDNLISNTRIDRDHHFVFITGASNGNPINITAMGHGLQTGARIRITGVGGNTATNGDWLVTVVDGNTLSLNGSTGNGDYTTGGLISVIGSGSDSFTVSGNRNVITGIHSYQSGALEVTGIGNQIVGGVWKDSSTASSLKTDVLLIGGGNSIIGMRVENTFNGTGGIKLSGTRPQATGNFVTGSAANGIESTSGTALMVGNIITGSIGTAISITTGDVERGNSPNDDNGFSDGSAATPSITWKSTPDSGLHRAGANVLGIAAGGVESAQFANTYIRFYQQVGLNSTPVNTWMQITPPQPVSVAGNGTRADLGLVVTGGTGGNSSGVTGQTGGIGSTSSIIGGNGGDVAGAGGIGGMGGSLTFTAGNGGAGAGTKGNGGDVIIQAGSIGGGTGTGGNIGNVRINPGGAATIATGTFTFMGTPIIATSSPPATSSSTGTTGTIAWANGFIYVCVATNTWQRVALTTW